MVGALHSVEGQFPDTGHDAGDAPHYRSVPAECTEAGSATGKTDTAQLFQSKLNLQ